MWEYNGKSRPPFAAASGQGQESVWDYPRPPAVVPTKKNVEVLYRGRMLAKSQHALRVLETAGPPTFYVPAHDVDFDCITIAPDTSWCEWKGTAKYWQLDLEGAPSVSVAWSYPDPNPDYRMLKRLMSFYPGRVDCFVDGERVRPQAGGFYGGWITSEIVGPIKGEPGTETW
jgi:uncharacterized protein (DUF427 family)